MLAPLLHYERRSVQNSLWLRDPWSSSSWTVSHSLGCILYLNRLLSFVQNISHESKLTLVTHFNLITFLKPQLQMRSCSEVLGVKTAMYVLGETLVDPQHTVMFFFFPVLFKGLLENIKLQA